MVPDLVVQLIVRWLAPASPWPLRLRDHWFWVDGFERGAVAGGVATIVLVLLARLALWLGARVLRWLRWLVRKRDRR